MAQSLYRRIYLRFMIKACGQWYLHLLITLPTKNNHFTSVNHFDQSHATSASSLTISLSDERGSTRHNMCDTYTGRTISGQSFSVLHTAEQIRRIYLFCLCLVQGNIFFISWSYDRIETRITFLKIFLPCP
jgi:hypothetical protein